VQEEDRWLLAALKRRIVKWLKTSDFTDILIDYNMSSNHHSTASKR